MINNKWKAVVTSFRDREENPFRRGLDLNSLAWHLARDEGSISAAVTDD